MASAACSFRFPDRCWRWVIGRAAGPDRHHAQPCRGDNPPAAGHNTSATLPTRPRRCGRLRRGHADHVPRRPGPQWRVGPVLATGAYEDVSDQPLRQKETPCPGLQFHRSSLMELGENGWKVFACEDQVVPWVQHARACILMHPLPMSGSVRRADQSPVMVDFPTPPLPLAMAMTCRASVLICMGSSASRRRCRIGDHVSISVRL